MAHKKANGKMEFRDAHIRVLDDGSFVLEEMFEFKRKPPKDNHPVECLACERLEYSYEKVEDLLKDLGADLRELGKEKNNDYDEDEPKVDLKKTIKSEGEEDE